jgi:hypothetical protein
VLLLFEPSGDGRAYGLNNVLKWFRTFCPLLIGVEVVALVDWKDEAPAVLIDSVEWVDCVLEAVEQDTVADSFGWLETLFDVSGVLLCCWSFSVFAASSDLSDKRIVASLNKLNALLTFAMLSKQFQNMICTFTISATTWSVSFKWQMLTTVS